MKKVIIFISIITSIFILNNKVYAYQSYKIGDKVTYNDIDFYVIKDSSSDSDYVTLLKKEPLTVDEVTTYGAGHINRYTSSSQGVAYNQNGYGGMTYYSSDTCKENTETGCTSDYDDSDIKFAVDAWANDKLTDADLKADKLGYKARLLTFDEFHNLGYGEPQSPCGPSCGQLYYPKTDEVPEWLYNSNYTYWTMAKDETKASRVWGIDVDGNANANNIWRNYGSFVRPVVTFSKSALTVDDDNQDSKIIDDGSKSQDVIDNKNESKIKVNVPNTLKSISGLVILIGMVLVCVGLNLFIIIKNKDRKKD